jgi:hypothetical protein
MPSSFEQVQAVKLKFALDTFKVNSRFMMSEEEAERKKVLMAGASAYATSAQRHTPPALGQQDIPNNFYGTAIMDFVLPKGWKTGGMRVIYPLREVLKNPRTRRLKSMMGKLLRQGYEYVVVIHSSKQQRHGRWTYYKPCTTLDEAKKYATEDYRGLMRTAWGMGFIAETGKMPPVFKKYLRRRPKLAELQTLSHVRFFPEQNTVEVQNDAIGENEAFLKTTDLVASVAAVRTMNDQMSKFFKRKFDL